MTSLIILVILPIIGIFWHYINNSKKSNTNGSLGLELITFIGGISAIALVSIGFRFTGI